MWNAKVNFRAYRHLGKNSRLILKTGACMRTLEEHSETVTAISWLPDGSGFISGGLDRKVIIWVSRVNVPHFPLHWQSRFLLKEQPSFLPKVS